jgi:alpha-N-acetylglucosamine transferase
MAGCDVMDGKYRNYLYNILINARILRDQNSTAAIVVLVQMAYDPSFHYYETLSVEEERWLTSMHVQIRYIPKSFEVSFYTVNMDKFRILTLEEYDRVLFLDSDVMLRVPMDYLFTMPMQGILKENVIFAGRVEPSNAGIFLLAPKRCEWSRILDSMAATEERGRFNPYPYFDNRTGWGHVIVPPDYYEFHICQWRP